VPPELQCRAARDVSRQAGSCCSCIRLRLGEEALGGIDCSVPATFDSSLYDCVHNDAIGDANYVLHGALWGADCNTLYAASKLFMYSECLKYILEEVREQFLSLVADAVVATTIAAEIAAQQAATEYGKYFKLLFMSHEIVQPALFSACSKQSVCFSCF
jgi:hypothetical protein